MLPLLALTVALVWVDRRATRTAALADGTDAHHGRHTTASKLPTVLAVLAVVAALACTRAGLPGGRLRRQGRLGRRRLRQRLTGAAPC